MWYGSEEKSQVTFKFKVGPLKMGWNEFYVGCITILTVYPPVLLISELFRRSRKNRNYIADPLERKFKMLDEGIEKELPRWVLVVAWIVALVAIAAGSFFTFLYSLDWGGDKSNEWLGAFFLSFVETLFLVDPFLVCCSFCLFHLC